MKKVFRVYCEFLVKADNPKDIEGYLATEDNFVESHIIIEENNIAGGLIPRLKYEADTEKEIYKEL